MKKKRRMIEFGERLAWDGIAYGWLLYLSLQPVLQLREGTRTMGKRVLLCFVHLGVRLAFILEDRIPACMSRSVTLISSPRPSSPRKHKIAHTHTKSSTTPRRHYLPLQQTYDQPNPIADKQPGSLATYINPSLKDQHLMPRPLTVRKRAYSLSGFILICHEQVIKTFEANRLKEPFSIDSVLCLSNNTTDTATNT